MAAESIATPTPAMLAAKARREANAKNQTITLKGASSGGVAVQPDTTVNAKTGAVVTKPSTPAPNPTPQPSQNSSQLPAPNQPSGGTTPNEPGNAGQQSDVSLPDEIKNSDEYKINMGLSQPVFDSFNKQTSYEKEKLDYMSKLFRDQALDSQVELLNQKSGLLEFSQDTQDLLDTQLENEKSFLEKQKASDLADLEEAKAEAESKLTEAVIDQQQANIKEEQRRRTMLGFSGGFGSTGQIQEMDSQLDKGRAQVNKLKMEQAKLSVTFAKETSKISQSYNKQISSAMAEYNKQVITLKYSLKDGIDKINSQILSTKQEKDKQIASLVSGYYANIGEIEGKTAAYMAQVNKETYGQIMDAKAAELKAQQEANEKKWTRAFDLIDRYGGETGAVYAEKLLGLPDGSLPRTQTVEESKQAFAMLKEQNDEYWRQANYDLQRDKFSYEQDQDAANDTGSLYGNGGTANPGNKIIGDIQVPQKIADNIFGLGKVGDWCGTYASKYSTAPKVGNTWAEKKKRIDKRDNPKAGDKLLIPIGVGSDGDESEFGHVVFVTGFNPKTGDIEGYESNADGRQSRGRGKGIVTRAKYNINTLRQQYGKSFGFASGEIKPQYRKALEEAGEPLNQPNEYAPDLSNLGGNLLNFVMNPVRGTPGLLTEAVKAMPKAPEKSIADRYFEITKQPLLPKSTDAKELKMIENDPAKLDQYFAAIVEKQKKTDDIATMVNALIPD